MKRKKKIALARRNRRRKVAQKKMTAPQIRTLRVKKLGLSQAKFAKLIGVARRTAQGWEAETDRHAPSGMALKRLRELDLAAEEGPP